MSSDTTAGLGARLTREVGAWARAHGPGLVVGVSGPQGSGKSTACAEAARRLEGAGLRTVVLSLDDLYLPRRERKRVAHDVHPLLVTRGPPGTHDALMGAALLDALRRPGRVTLPRFSKARDERKEARDGFEAPADVVLFEGWCVGVRPQGTARLDPPVNALEREEDSDGRWRRHVDHKLATSYRLLWERLDRLVVLRAPDWATVVGWRAQAEEELRARTGLGMAPSEFARFMAHYERLTGWAALDLPPRADLVLALDAERRVLA